MLRITLLAPLFLLGGILATVTAGPGLELAPAPRPAIDLTGYRTAAAAARADGKQFNTTALTSTATAGYLGVVVGSATSGHPVVEAVEPGSPADAAGLRPSDVIRKVDSTTTTSAYLVRDVLRSRLAGDRVALAVDRDGQSVVLSPTLTPTTRPMAATGERAVMGVRLGPAAARGGVRVDEVTTAGPADKAGVKTGDVITRLDGRDVDGPASFRELMADRHPGDGVDVIAERDGRRVEARVVLTADAPTPGRGSGWDDRIPSAWRRPTYRLAVIGIEYPDVKHNPKIKDADWAASLFSRGTYTGTSATGEAVYGSMNDYYAEQSKGTFRVDGDFLGWVTAKKTRLEYSTGSGTDSREKTALLTEALDRYAAAHGADSLKGYDGVFFIYAGGRVETTRGGLYWPHRANVSHAGRRWPYFIVQEGGNRMTDISVFCHEFGHMLGLPDLYARPELPGSEGVGVWCAMSTQARGGRPQHFCAWSKEQLGWVKPVVLDPRVRQKLILSPVEDDPTQVYKVMVRADGSEYFLLENRRKKGFDASLPGEGLLIWRVVHNRPVLEESHGVEGASGPRVYLPDVPYPSTANASFTPYTVPSSRSHLGGGLPVYVTNIRRLPDGRITFHIGYEYQ